MIALAPASRSTNKAETRSHRAVLLPVVESESYPHGLIPGQQRLDGNPTPLPRCAITVLIGSLGALSINHLVYPAKGAAVLRVEKTALVCLRLVLVNQFRQL